MYNNYKHVTSVSEQTVWQTTNPHWIVKEYFTPEEVNTLLALLSIPDYTKDETDLYNKLHKLL